MILRKTLFWDVDTTKINPQTHAKYIIERVLDMGNDKEVRWLLSYYGKPRLNKVITGSRSLKPSTKKLWNLILQK